MYIYNSICLSYAILIGVGRGKDRERRERERKKKVTVGKNPIHFHAVFKIIKNSLLLLILN